MISGDWIVVQDSPLVIWATVAAAVAALCNLVIAIVLGSYQRRLTKAELEPRVVAYFSQEKVDGQDLVYLNVENIGRAPAQSVLAEIEVSIEEMEGYIFFRRLQQSNSTNIHVPVLRHGERATKLFHNRSLPETIQTRIPPFAMKVRYRDLTERKFDHVYSLNMGTVSSGWTLSKA